MNEDIKKQITEIRDIIATIREKINPADPMFEELQDDLSGLDEAVIELAADFFDD